MSFWQKFRPDFWHRQDEQVELLDYRRLWKTTFWAAVIASLTPVFVLAGVNFFQYGRQYDSQYNEITIQVQREMSTAKLQVTDFLNTAQAALTFVNLDNTITQLGDSKRLSVIFRQLRYSFGGFVDLGLINFLGIQKAYIGPYNLSDVDYRDQEWYQVALIRGAYVSDVFMGHRNFPHMVIAVRHEEGGEGPAVLRATIDTGRLNQMVRGEGAQDISEIFLVNQQGKLQTPSRHFGGVLAQFGLLPESRKDWEGISVVSDEHGEHLFMGLANIEDTPFTLVVIHRPGVLLQKWGALGINLIIVVSVSVLIILGVIWWGSTTLVSRIYVADLRRASVLHEVEYTNKLASIGRLAAGVAHEINNPVAIINEKVGLMEDLLKLTEDFPRKEKFLQQIGVVQQSVKRVSDITHRLLGFARHLPVKREQIHLDGLLNEVLGFLGREAEYRNIKIDLNIDRDVPPVNGDRGQLQQVFLNILNNAMAAVQKGGNIDISAKVKGEHRVEVAIADDGMGIPPADLQKIFEPFFSTKGERGTGLGLSITYGIVQKMGGTIEVESQEQKGTTFHVFLPADVAPRMIESNGEDDTGPEEKYSNPLVEGDSSV